MIARRRKRRRRTEKQNERSEIWTGIIKYDFSLKGKRKFLFSVLAENNFYFLVFIPAYHSLMITMFVWSMTSMTRSYHCWVYNTNVYSYILLLVLYIETYPRSFVKLLPYIYPPWTIGGNGLNFENQKLEKRIDEEWYGRKM